MKNMSMRSQIYAWNGNSFLGAAGAVATSFVPATSSGVQTSIFIGGFGNNITKPAETTATEFVVIEDVSCTPSLNANAGVSTNSPEGATAAAPATNTVGTAPSQLVTGQLASWQLTNNLGLTALGPPDVSNYTGCSAGVFGPRMYVQVRINTTDYFLNPDNVTNDGIPGTASPYPRSLDFQPSFNLYPDVYVLPGQVWDVRVTSYCRDAVAIGATGAGGAVTLTANAGDWGKAPAGTASIIAGAGSLMNGIDFNAFCKYTLYDGPDALIANKLLEMGISINPGNVDWYKRSLLSAQGM